MKHTLLPLFLTLTFCACKQPPVEQKVSIFDSAMNVYLEEKFDDPYVDTTQIDNHLLLGVYKKDSLLTHTYLDRKKDRKQDKQFSDSILYKLFPSLKELYELNADEAYRFTYSQSFRPYIIMLTVSRKSHDNLLEIRITTHPHNYTSSDAIDTTYNIALSESEYSEFIQKLNYADFWGMKRDNRGSGLDGTNLNVWGLDKAFSPPYTRTNKIHRWSPEETAIFEAYRYLLSKTELKNEVILYFRGKP